MQTAGVVGPQTCWFEKITLFQVSSYSDIVCGAGAFGGGSACQFHLLLCRELTQTVMSDIRRGCTETDTHLQLEAKTVYINV